jgi:hypothetical protein
MTPVPSTQMPQSAICLVSMVTGGPGRPGCEFPAGIALHQLLIPSLPDLGRPPGQGNALGSAFGLVAGVPPVRPQHPSGQCLDPDGGVSVP